MVTTILPHSMAKAKRWEIAKGHLRALVAMDGAVRTEPSERPFRFEVVGAAVEKFIADFEEHGFHEGMD